ncbi:GNAT family N-acetyltransferase [Viridibacillus sp. YIM B01967]|uniref:GNAT family N-acetyltransferase n=2 Tax=Viridibacillus soli TaxID=2798301 RepID=A0ABS1HCJ4_9BACL|nr:GNAT family N-acetyltransferase [Viridibacillus soli]
MMATNKDVEILHKIQVEAFMPLLQKYNDTQTNPAKETIEKLAERIAETRSDYYVIHFHKEIVGGIRVVPLSDNRTRISPIYIGLIYQGKGIAQEVFKQIEQMYSATVEWELDTIKQEKGNCYLYEKLGYRKAGKEVVINDKMTLISYLKKLN